MAYPYRVHNDHFVHESYRLRRETEGDDASPVMTDQHTTRCCMILQPVSPLQGHDTLGDDFQNRCRAIVREIVASATSGQVQSNELCVFGKLRA